MTQEANTNNYMELWVASLSENESFCRVAVAAFCSRLDPTVDQINDIKTAVSEAVTNSIIHGYHNQTGKIRIRGEIIDQQIFLEIEDYGIGINNLDQAKEPLYTTRPELERSGMGFTIMENFMDRVEITSAPNQGTLVKMSKELAGPEKE